MVGDISIRQVLAPACSLGHQSKGTLLSSIAQSHRLPGQSSTSDEKYHGVAASGRIAKDSYFFMKTCPLTPAQCFGHPLLPVVSMISYKDFPSVHQVCWHIRQDQSARYMGGIHSLTQPTVLGG